MRTKSCASVAKTANGAWLDHVKFVCFGFVFDAWGILVVLKYCVQINEYSTLIKSEE